MAANLVFGRPRYTGGPVLLVFGSGLGPVTPDPVGVDITLQLGDVQVTALVVYDNKNPRRASTSAAMPHQVAARASLEPRAAHGLAARMERQGNEQWQQAQVASTEPALRWGKSATAGTERGAAWELAQQVVEQWALVHQSAAILKRQAATPWQPGAPASDLWALVHQAAALHRRQAAAPWQLAQQRDATRLSPHGLGDARRRSLLAPWQTSRPVPPGLEVWPPVDPGARPPREINTHLVFACPAWAGGPVHLVFGRVCGTPPGPQATVVVPVRSVYMIVNSASLRRVSNNQSLPTYSTSLTIDSDSWTWSFSATMPADALSMIQRVDPAEPVEVELSINGNTYRALIESAVRSRTFKDWTLTVRGRGLGAVLDAPYAPQQIFLNTAPLTAQQLMEDALTINGQSIGWTLDWGITDWLVPAQAWSHQGSMMSAVNMIAAAAGAYIQPHPISQILRVLPKYPSAPWDWATVTPDYQLPADVMSVEGIEWVDRADYNRMFVSGVQHGVIGQVTRLGTAGDLVAPMVTDPLITHVDAARQRGLSELAKGGRWAEMNLKLPVLPGVGVIHPGKFVRYNDGALDRLGIVRSLNVADDGQDIWQTIGVESYVA